MTFGEAISTCYRKYADFSGRAGLAEYWYWFLYQSIGYPALIFLAAAVPGSGSGVVSVTLLALFLSVNLVPGLAVAVRRLHDTNHSLAFYFINLIPLIGTIVFLVTLAKRGDRSANLYGPPTPPSADGPSSGETV